MKLRVVVEKDPTTGRFSAVFPELPGGASAGDIEVEAMGHAREALALRFEPDNPPRPKNSTFVGPTT